MMRLLSGICLALLIPLSVQSADIDADTAQKKLESISTEIEQNREKITKKKKVKRKIQRDLGVISRELRVTEIKLKKAQERLKATRREVDYTRKEIRKLEADFKKKKDALADHLVGIYKHQNIGWLGMVFAQKDFFHLSSASYYYTKLIKADYELVASIRQSYQDLVTEKKRLDLKKKKLTNLKDTIAVSERKLEEKSTLKARRIRELKREISTIEKQNRELEESSLYLAKMIRKLGKGKLIYYGTGSFLRPVKGWISSRYGKRLHPIFKRWIRHNGLDFAAPRGYRIRAADTGVVIVAGKKRQYRGYGNVTVIDHGWDKKSNRRISSVYAHQSRILIKEGDLVKKGDEIGWVGSTGYSTGPHLHFEIRENGRPVNPEKYLKL